MPTIHHYIHGRVKIHSNIKGFHSAGTIITIGTFDGVHLGHNQVIAQIIQLAKKENLESLIFTFYPHPRQVVAGHDESLRLLNTLEEKKELLSNTGIDHLLIFPFTPEFSKLPYDVFVKEILIEHLNMKAIVVGHDHKLGKNREGGFDNLLLLSQDLGFKIFKTEAFVVEDTDISSTKIRKALEAGHIAQANRYLGYPYFLRGTVSQGNKLGRTIGFPTANIIPPDPYKLVPYEGVYAVQVKVGETRYNGMLNIGFRPTVNQNLDHRTIEAHLFGFEGDLYGQNIAVCFHERIRDEMKFNNLEELKLQLEKDQVCAKKLLTRSSLC